MSIEGWKAVTLCFDSPALGHRDYFLSLAQDLDNFLFCIQQLSLHLETIRIPGCMFGTEEEGYETAK